LSPAPDRHAPAGRKCRNRRAHWRGRGGILGLAFGGLLAGQVHAAGPDGLWLSQDHDAVIAIGPCEGGLCGRIVGMSEPRGKDGSVPADPQGHPMCGLNILHAEPDGPDRWSGRITDPEDGSNWRCILSFESPDRLLLHGYVLVPMFGRTQTWTRYGGRVDDDCRMGA
jgi:uncharacterized protein (DUF2147 family)